MVDRCLLSLLIWTSHFLAFIFVSLISFISCISFDVFPCFFLFFLRRVSPRPESHFVSPLGSRGPCVAWGKSWAYRPAAKTNDPRRERMPRDNPGLVGRCWKSTLKKNRRYIFIHGWVFHSHVNYCICWRCFFTFHREINIKPPLFGRICFFTFFASIEHAHPRKRNASGCEDGNVWKYVESWNW